MNYPDRTQEPVYQEQEHEKRPKAVSSTRSLLLTFIQIGACVVIIAAAGCLKLIGGTIYSTAASWFFDHYNNTIFVTDASGFFPFSDPVSITESSRPYGVSDKTSAIKLQSPLTGGTVTSGFGERDNGGEKQQHKGTDIAASEGTPICAAGDGTVTIAEENSSYGKYIVIEHTGEVKTLYAHCSQLLCKKGDKVSAGAKIALVGHTGDADGSHLHFEVICEGKNIDPESVLQ